MFDVSDVDGKEETEKGCRSMSRPKDILTTGEVARICNVAPRTVSKWFDSGQLRGYRIPGSKDRRIPMSSLVRFMADHDIPLDGVQSGRTRILIVDEPSELMTVLRRLLVEQAGYEVQLAHSTFAAGASCEKNRPHVMLMDMHIDGVESERLLQDVRSHEDLQLIKLVAISGKLTEGQCRHLLKTGYDGYLRKPFTVKHVTQVVEEVTSLVH